MMKKKASQLFSAPVAAAVESWESHQQKAFKNAFAQARERGELFIGAVIKLKKITLACKNLSWELVCEDLGYTVDALDRRIYRHDHPDYEKRHFGSRTCINTAL